ncbi:MAG: hypothetical protein K0S07_917 [Chlamydiales bacterium]|jgi:uncharacterized protein (DUF58 family)|nr:hypothetical protein [Chlamydiales bacterium]
MIFSKELLKKVKGLKKRSSLSSFAWMAGAYRSAFKGSGMSFLEVRPFSEGDDIRSIDWNVTARTQVLHTKRFQEEKAIHALLMVDLSPSMDFGSGDKTKAKAALEIAALIALSAMQNGDSVGLISFREHVESYLPPKKGMAHALKICKELEQQKKAPRTDLKGALQFLLKKKLKKARVFLISDFLCPPCEREMTLVAKSHYFSAIRISDPLEEAWPDVGQLHLCDLESEKEVQVDARQANALFQAEREKREAMQDRLKKARASLIALNTGEDYLKKLFSAIQRMRCG